MENDAYGISRWGDGLIGVLTNGNVCLHDPLSKDASPVDLAEVIQKQCMVIFICCPETTGNEWIMRIFLQHLTNQFF